MPHPTPRILATLVLAACAVRPAPAGEAPAGVPPPSAGAALSPFCIGACNQTSQELDRWIPQMEAIGLGVMRTCRTHWSAVEPEEGKWDWEALDRQMRYGFRNCGWYTVPDNKQWHTARWTIRDAQFVNYWGFNFSLNSDGNLYNKYFIQSVTVTKLEP